MYIAFKWLVSMASFMWVAICLVDSCVKGYRWTNAGIEKPFDNFKNKSFQADHSLDSASPNRIGKFHVFRENEDQNTAGLHLIMFIAGALAVTAFHKKQDIVTFVHKKIPTINMVARKLLSLLKIAAIKLRVAIIVYTLHLWERIEITSYKIRNKVNGFKLRRTVKHNKIHVILLKKLKEMTEERKNLGQLLISAIRENKNIRMRYELETMTKNRLMQHIEDTQKQIKENRNKYVNFQQLYLMTHQENNYLKARLVKLKKEKDAAEKNLAGLINKVYLSQNQDLKMYCSRFLVKTKDNLLNSDVTAEIKEFLKNCCNSSEEILTTKTKRNQAPKPCTSNICITEIENEDNCLVPLVSDAPKLRGLPGEYVWTVKDKDGIIEKLYEYNCESDLDSGDTIRRIRQYSVYYDKDCLLDFSNFSDDRESGVYHSTCSNILEFPICNKKIVTGSEAFQNFLKNSRSIIQLKPTSMSSVIS